ncbi:MAG: hypothetical protein FWF50_07890 [Defluviitaleaceae bacterium]|nr:hypothetical protein [Defluviitaleaceae bacterium]
MKLKTIFTTAVLTAVLAVPAFAFSRVEGTVTNVRDTEVTIRTNRGNYNRNYTILLENTPILKDTLLAEVRDINEGDDLVVIYEQSQISPLIYPPQREAHVALLFENEAEQTSEAENGTRGIINMVELLPYYARGNNAAALQTLGTILDVIDTNYYTGIEIFDDIFNF